MRSQTDFANNCVNTNKFRRNSLIYFASKVWSLVSLEIKNSRSVEKFKTKVRNWEPKDCDCYLCKTYINILGFVNVILKNSLSLSLLSYSFSIPYRKLARVGFEPMTSCLPCTPSNHWTIWPNDEICLMVYRIKWPRSSSHR